MMVIDGIGNRAACQDGATSPKREGPSTTPAIISPTASGWPTAPGQRADGSARAQDDGQLEEEEDRLVEVAHAGLRPRAGRPSTSEVEAADPFIASNGLPRPIEAVPPELQHVGVVRDLERLGGVLLDHENGLAAAPEVRDDAKDLPEDQGRQAE